MKEKIRRKLMVTTAFFLFFAVDLGAEVLVDDFQYQPNAADYQGTWRTNATGVRKIILSGVLNTNIEMDDVTAEDLRKIARSSHKGFEIRRDAGTFFFEGCISNSGKGSGRFYFRPDRGYADKMNTLLSPVPTSSGAAPNSVLFYCAVHNVTYDYAKKIMDTGYNKISTNDLLVLRSVGVTPEYVRTMADIGYEDISPDDLILAISFRIFEYFFPFCFHPFQCPSYCINT